MRSPEVQDSSPCGNVDGVLSGIDAKAKRQVDTRAEKGPPIALSWFLYEKVTEDHRTSCQSRGSALEKGPREAVGYRVPW